MLKIKIEISKENIDNNAVGFNEDCRRWAFDDNATIETLYNRVILEKYLPTNMIFADGWTLYVDTEPIFYISKFLNNVDYYIDKNHQLSSFVSNNSFICTRFIIKTNAIYKAKKLYSDKKVEMHKNKLEKIKESYTKKYRETNIETIYNKIIELKYKDNSFKKLSEIVYVFSNVLTDKTKNNTKKYLNTMLDELYNIIFDDNEFNKLIQEKYSWLSKENKNLVKINLRYAAK